MNVREQQPQEAAPIAEDRRQTAWEVFRFYSGSQDQERFRVAYVGHWPDRGAFGEHLLADYGADRYLRGLPPWLQRYTQLDGQAFAADFEQAGHYYIAEVRDAVYVFDPHV